MIPDFNSLKQAALALPLEAAQFEPATSFINSINALKAIQAEAVLFRISEDTNEFELRRLSAQKTLEEIKVARLNR